MYRFSLALYLVTSLFLASPNIIANDQQAKTTQMEQDVLQVVEALQKAAVIGPSTIKLGDQATLNLQNDYVFVPKEEAANYMKALGHRDTSDLLGMIMPLHRSNEWAITIRYNPDGYVHEDDADKWNADDLLNGLKEGTEEANEERKKQGYEPMYVLGWIEKPSYDKANHKMVWSIEGKVDDPSNQEGIRFVNYKTYAFGRFGFLELTLSTSKEDVEANKLHAANILKSIQFNTGYRYEDYVEGMDKAAGYGLAALVAGVAAKKLGLLAMAGVFLLKIWKFIAIGAILAFGFIRRLFGKKKDKGQE